MNIALQLSKIERYSNGLYPKKPAVKPGYAVVLSGGKKPPVIVDDRLSIRMIRVGRFDRISEIRTGAYATDVRMEAMSKDAPYQFEIIAKVRVQIVDPLAFHKAGVTDVPTALSLLLFSDVRDVAKQFGIREIIKLDDALREAFPQTDVYDKSTGMRYLVAGIAAQPVAYAMERHLQSLIYLILQTLDETELKDISIEATVLVDLAIGRISMDEALERIKRSYGQRIDGSSSLRIEGNAIEGIDGSAVERIEGSSIKRVKGTATEGIEVSSIKSVKGTATEEIEGYNI